MSSNVTSVAAGIEQTTTNLSHVAAAKEQMNLLGAAAREIGKVTQAITEISSKTNLLALTRPSKRRASGPPAKASPWSRRKSRCWHNRPRYDGRYQGLDRRCSVPYIGWHHGNREDLGDHQRSKRHRGLHRRRY